MDSQWIDQILGSPLLIHVSYDWLLLTEHDMYLCANLGLQFLHCHGLLSMSREVFSSRVPLLTADDQQTGTILSEKTESFGLRNIVNSTRSFCC